ncbi:MAG: cyclopropane-fatty-acyl-phospholipid synthase [Gammaproteobacteria bacterium]|jgi:cyclopropane-fatty-acyl-phospholipid synthase
MKSSIVPYESGLVESSKESWLHSLARKQVIARLRSLRHGELIIREGHQESYFGDTTSEGRPRIHLQVHHASFWSDIAFAGGVGAGEAYIKGSWSCSDLVGLMRLLIKNQGVTDSIDRQLFNIKRPLMKTLHYLSRNTKNGSLKNIRAHYDLSNDFFELFLDKTMMYSCAYYDEQAQSLEQASTAKLDMVCQKLDLGPEDHLLEIGTGWGGLALHAAQYYGCKVTTTTISQEQYQYAKSRIARAGLSHRVEVLLKDYRDLDGQYDKLVSIEMIEAVGHQFLDTYFEQCNRLLKPSGRMLLQAITIIDKRYKAALKRVDFIKQYIFPGGFLPSVAAMTNSIGKVTDMKVIHLQDIGEHYAVTLNGWKKRFMNRIDDVRQQGYSDMFIRMWEYYLDYCQAGFRENYLGTVQMLMTKEVQV